MPKYLYRCFSCDYEQTATRTVEARDAAPVCFCGSPTERIFSARFQIIGEREADKGENKYAYGFDESTRLETMKAEEKEYEARYANVTLPTTKTPKQHFKDMPLAELHHQLHGAMS